MAKDTMRRKFAFGLAPSKTVANTHARGEAEHAATTATAAAVPAPSAVTAHISAKSTSQSKSRAQKTASDPPPPPQPSHAQPHLRAESKDSICNDSPWIHRRILDTRTEHELRAACRLIAQNFNPADAPAPPRRDVKLRSAPVRVRMPTGAPAVQEAQPELSKPARQNASKPTSSEQPVRANSSRKRADFAWLDDRDDKREAKFKKYAKTSFEASRTDPARVEADLDDTKSLTPNTASKHASTAPTSVSLSSNKESNRRSRLLDLVSTNESHTTEESRANKVDHKEAAPPQARPSTAVRPLSRARSFRNNIKDFVFPSSSSRNLSRKASQESLATVNTHASQSSSHHPPPPRTDSAFGWRAWALPRPSSRNSRPTTARTNSDASVEPKKSDVPAINLNRELPPLPSLDTWKDAQEEHRKSAILGSHIANLMRPDPQPRTDSATAPTKSHRRSGSDSLALQYAASQKNLLQHSPVTKKPTPPSRHSKMLSQDSLAQIDDMLLTWSASNGATPDPESAIGTTAANASVPKSSPSPPSKPSLEIPNFSRKMSAESPRRSVFHSHGSGPYPGEAAGMPLSPKEEQKSRLRRVFSGWVLRKERKERMKEGERWAVRLDGGGVQGVEEGAVAPVIRY